MLILLRKLVGKGLDEKKRSFQNLRETALVEEIKPLIKSRFRYFGSCCQNEIDTCRCTDKSLLIFCGKN